MSNLFFITLITASLLHTFKCIEGIPTFDLYRIFYKQESNVEKANQYIRARLEANESIIFFIKDKERCVGFTQLYPTFDSVRLRKKIVLYDLFICEDYRRKGNGKILMDAAKDLSLIHI